jgi:hypothetical protein
MTKQRLLILIIAVVLVALAGVGGWYLWLASQPIPRSILKRAEMGVWYPNDRTTGYKIERNSVKYNDTGSDKLVTFVAQGVGNALTFTEQPTPESFIDVPQVYDKLTEKLHEYAKVESVNGTASLTRPDELKGRQTLVMKARGTLMFVKPDKNLSTDEWRKVLNNLEFVH